ncbi:TetR/AcrR family transcriptional regulator [Bradyrhizobium sp. WD16]|nr:TetR/AcrR family transcriptional regulator [Bradyrhizobium sp. WD16]
MKATLHLLLTQGYTRLTTIDVAREAGLSKGALTHNFKSKEDLVVQSIEHQLRTVTADLSAFVEGGTSSFTSSREIVDYLWNLMAGGLFYTTMEYLPEARHNHGFRTRLIPVVQEFHAAIDQTWQHLSQRRGLSPTRAETMLNATMCLIRGMVAQSVLRDDPAYFEAILSYWKEQLEREIETSPRNT